MKKKTIHLISAARPNFMKIAPLYHALKRGTAPCATEPQFQIQNSKFNKTEISNPRSGSLNLEPGILNPVIVHTGQHYDLNMSDAFFTDLNLPAPHIHLGVGSGTHAEQTGQVMMAYEKVLLKTPPDLAVVVGDVNSTVACTLAAVKLGVKTAHLEAGLRSFDRTMPEEINRRVTDAIADILWTPSPDADENLKREGVSADKIVRVGNIMIDSLEMLRDKIEAEDVCSDLGIGAGDFALVTLHRPANVDRNADLQKIINALLQISARLPIVFPVHPRTLKSLKRFDLLNSLENDSKIFLLEPQPYVRFMSLLFNSRLLITDSGGIQEETSYLGIPCLTLRPNTERPITVNQGTNQLCSAEMLNDHVRKIMSGGWQKGTIPDLWDGNTASRVVESIRSTIGP